MIGEDVLDAVDESRECAWYGDPLRGVSSSCIFATLNLGKVNERIRLMLYICFHRLALLTPRHRALGKRCTREQTEMRGGHLVVSSATKVLRRGACVGTSKLFNSF